MTSGLPPGGFPGCTVVTLLTAPLVSLAHPFLFKSWKKSSGVGVGNPGWGVVAQTFSEFLS